MIGRICKLGCIKMQTTLADDCYTLNTLCTLNVHNDAALNRAALKTAEWCHQVAVLCRGICRYRRESRGDRGNPVHRVSEHLTSESGSGVIVFVLMSSFQI